MKFLFRIRSRSLVRTAVVLAAAVASIYLQLQFHHAQSKPAVRMKAAVLFPMIIPETPKAAAPEPVVTTLRIERNQTFSSLMNTVGVDPQTAQQIYDSCLSVYNLKKIQAGAALTLTSADGDH